MKFRFRFRKWFHRLVHVRSTEQQFLLVVAALFTVATVELSAAAAADAAAVVQLQLHQLADHVVAVAVATSST